MASVAAPSDLAQSERPHPWMVTDALVQLDYAYDLAGNLLSTTDSRGGVTSYTYSPNALARLESVKQSVWDGVSDTVNKRADYTYNADGSVDTVTRYSSDTTDSSALVAQSVYVYDAAGHLSSLVHTPTAGSAISYGWNYDQAGRIRRMTTPDGVSNYELDQTSQLTSADHNYQADEGYTYDANSNRIQSGADDGVAANNHLDFDGVYHYAYDHEGNRESRFLWTDANQNGVVDAGEKSQITEYGWDYHNRLTSVTLKSDENTVLKTVAYTYDYAGQMIRKGVDADGPGAGAETFTYTVYDGDNACLEIVDPTGLGNGADDSVVNHRYFYGQAVDEILADEYDGEVRWSLADHEGTVRDVLDAAGAVLDHLKYDSFGQIMSHSAVNPTALDFVFGYTGRPQDADTKLYNYRARWYDAQVGRFASEDPSGFSGGDMNLYRYVHNDPLSYTDPSGLCEKDYSKVDSYDSWGKVFDSIGQAFNAFVDTPFPGSSASIGTEFADLNANYSGFEWLIEGFSRVDHIWNDYLQPAVANYLPQAQTNPSAPSMQTESGAQGHWFATDLNGNAYPLPPAAPTIDTYLFDEAAPLTKPVYEDSPTAWLDRHNSQNWSKDPETLAIRQQAERSKVSSIDAIQNTLDVWGVAEPTPFCDLTNSVISAARGNWSSAGISLLGVIPYVGDAAKLAKYGSKLAVTVHEFA